MAKLLKTTIAVIAVAALLTWNFWLRPARESFEKQRDRCRDVITGRLWDAGKKALAYPVGDLGNISNSPDGHRLVFNVFVGEPPKNPPLERDSFFNAHALCDVDKYGVENVSIHSGSAGAAGIRPSD